MNERTRRLLVSLRHARRAYAFEHGREPTHVALNPADVLELETAPALSAFADGCVGERFVAGCASWRIRRYRREATSSGTTPTRGSSSERPEGEEATKIVGTQRLNAYP